MCPRTCCCPQCPPYPPSDGNKGPARQPLLPHRPLVRSQRAESPRHTPSTLCQSSGAAAAAFAAFASASSGQLLTGLACRRRSTFWPSLIRSHTPTLLLPPRLPLPRHSALSVGAHAGRLGKTVRQQPHNCSSASALCCWLWMVLGSGRASSETLEPETANLGILSPQSALR